MLSNAICQKARLSRDARFDGKFFIAVKTTGIYCRPICPATMPKEKNVHYFASAIEAANQGYRPCLRCRPDSAPGSPAWKGINTTLDRAIKLIGEGALHEGSLQSLAQRLGISDRYLRQLFEKHLGVSPKTFALYQQCLFAKQLLHQTSLPITQIALASGFNSVRRFNDCFSKNLNLTPSQIRESRGKKSAVLTLKLYYRPPYDWELMHNFLSNRFIPELEWVGDNSYGRAFQYLDTVGQFTVKHVGDKNRFDLTIELNQLIHLKSIINNIRRILDLDADSEAIDTGLQEHYGSIINIKPGVRLPGTWSIYEAGIRAILGQQISVVAARNLVTKLVETYGETLADKRIFPSPQAIAASDIECLKMPGSRKQTLRTFSEHCLKQDNATDPEQWLSLKGVGPWTVNYARLRGLSDPDIYLGSDLGVKKAVKESAGYFNPELAAPWRSYLTLQLWNQL